MQSSGFTSEKLSQKGHSKMIREKRAIKGFRVMAICLDSGLQN
jgi:hypothetical protein